MGSRATWVEGVPDHPQAYRKYTETKTSVQSPFLSSLSLLSFFSTLLTFHTHYELPFLSDALIIAKLALQGEGMVLTPASFAPLKPITRTERKLTAIAQMLKLMEARIQAIFPEETDVIAGLASPRKELERSIKTFRRRSQALTDRELQRLLASIPGIGSTIATALIAEIEDVSRFPSSKSLLRSPDLIRRYVKAALP